MAISAHVDRLGVDAIAMGASALDHEAKLRETGICTPRVLVDQPAELADFSTPVEMVQAHALDKVTFGTGYAGQEMDGASHGCFSLVCPITHW